MAVSCMRHASGHKYSNSSFIVNVPQNVFLVILNTIKHFEEKHKAQPYLSELERVPETCLLTAVTAFYGLFHSLSCLLTTVTSHHILVFHK